MYNFNAVRLLVIFVFSFSHVILSGVYLKILENKLIQEDKKDFHIFLQMVNISSLHGGQRIMIRIFFG
jgi:hypothetical protein